ncbi:hypothetical protein FEZ32_01915 [Acidipropionibacterium jensenii]|uniref:hypothetical protein n=1 Tax=Acidipropionibacterium jensenii TaxID=1749 RepID=UPI00110BC3C3|nr:hypothetical protein [Acidipropionibacterium jensenii]QCV87276.1 hypothetical protein FEZ32_01915 [Acidipropionibacterium jensenii]
MAEIRTHKSSSNPIAQALAAAMGDPIRPLTPGARPVGADDDDRPEAAGPASLTMAAGWQGFTVGTVSAGEPAGKAGSAEGAEAADDAADGEADEQDA